MKTEKIYPNTGETIAGKICVHFKCTYMGKTHTENLPNSFAKNAVTCEDIQKSFFDSRGGNYGAGYTNCQVTMVQSRNWSARP
jgi:hypothetical protein